MRLFARHQWAAIDAIGQPFKPGDVDPYRTPDLLPVATEMDDANARWSKAIAARDVLALVRAQRYAQEIAERIANAVVAAGFG
jgi:hypothetical protein